MSVKIQFFEGEDTTMENDGAVQSAYRILDSGVLQLLVNRGKEASTMSVDREYSPHHWKAVYGTRYMSDSSNHIGTDGRLTHDGKKTYSNSGDKRTPSKEMHRG